MEFFVSFNEIVNTYLILSLPAMILTIVAAAFTLGPRLRTAKALDIIRWIILIYGTFNLLIFLLSFFLGYGSFNFFALNKPHAAQYWIMAFCACILPLTLLFKKLGSHTFYLFLLSVLINIGYYLELYSIILTTLLRDMDTIQDNAFIFQIIILPILFRLFKGAIFAGLLLFFCGLSPGNANVDDANLPLDSPL